MMMMMMMMMVVVVEEEDSELTLYMALVRSGSSGSISRWVVITS